MDEKILDRLSQITEEEHLILNGGEIDLTNYNATGIPIMDPGKIIPSGERFGIRPHTRFIDFPKHSHAYMEMIYQIKGQTEHIIDGITPLTLKAGQLVFLGRGTEHSVKAASRQDLAVNFVLIPTSFDSAVIQLGYSNALSVFLRDNLPNRKLNSGFLLFDVSQSLLIDNLLENLIQGEFEGVSMDIQQLTLELLIRQLSNMSGKLVVETTKGREQAIILEVLSRIERYTHLNLSDIALDLGIEVPRLSRMIKRHTGCNFSELLHTARFNRAIALLRDTDISIVDVATAIGYENTTFFYRQFRTRYGCTPSEYRRRIRTGAAVAPQTGMNANLDTACATTEIDFR